LTVTSEERCSDLCREGQGRKDGKDKKSLKKKQRGAGEGKKKNEKGRPTPSNPTEGNRITEAEQPNFQIQQENDKLRVQGRRGKLPDEIGDGNPERTKSPR